MSALTDFVRILVAKPQSSGATTTYGIVQAVNAGPPATYDVLRAGVSIPGIRRTKITAPIVNDRVLMIEQDGTVVIIGVMND